MPDTFDEWTTELVGRLSLGPVVVLPDGSIYSAGHLFVEPDVTIEHGHWVLARIGDNPEHPGLEEALAAADRGETRPMRLRSDDDS